MDILLDNSFGRVVFNNEDMDKVYINNELVWESGEKITAFKLVTDLKDLVDGSQIIFVNNYDFIEGTSDDIYIMGQQATNNRSAVVYSGIDSFINNDNSLLTDITSSNSDIVVFDIGINEDSDNKLFTFYDGSGYIYAASSSSNYLKTSEELTGDGYWKIFLIEDSVDGYIIQAQGDNTRNCLALTGSNTKVFTAMDLDNITDTRLVKIYKKTSIRSPE